MSLTLNHLVSRHYHQSIQKIIKIVLALTPLIFISLFAFQLIPSLNHLPDTSFYLYIFSASNGKGTKIFISC